MTKPVTPPVAHQLRRPLGALSAIALLTASLGAQAAITFDFRYTGNTPGVGFLDATTGAQRQAALTLAGTMYSDMFSAMFTNSATLRMDVTSVDNINTPTLASAGSLAVSGNPGFGGGEVIRTKLTTGVDLTGVASDGTVDVNFGYLWELNPFTPATATGPNQSFDFYAALFHEFTHALGFANNINFAGTDLFGNGNNGTAGSWAKYDQYLVNASGNRIIDGASFLTNATTWTAARTAAVFFDGANAKAANGGNAVDLYTPATWSDGSSIGHLNTDNAAYSTSMMKHNRDYGPETRTFSAIEIGVLQDLGYTLSPIPEPSTWALMLLGVAGLAVATRRRQSAA